LNRVHIKVRRNWSNRASTYACGYAYVGDELLLGDSLARYFTSKSVEEFESKLRKAGGFFAAIHAENDVVLLGVDHVASFPLFFGSGGNDIYVGDDPYWIAEQLKEDRYERLAMAEFLLSENITGHDTLFPRVKRVQAGEMLFLRAASGGIAITDKEYYAYTHHGFFREDEDSLLKNLETCMSQAFERLVRSVNGRLIAVSLSGGYDSRLVAMMLKKLGYRRVICFSYGVSGNFESKISKRVAQQLGFHWEFIPYNASLWFEWFHSAQRKSCIRYADGLTSSPYVQDWPALSKMKQEGIIPENSVVIQGHGGDFQAGGLLPTALWAKRRFDLDFILETIRARHWNCWDHRRLGLDDYLGESTESLLSRLIEKTRALCAGIPCSTPQQAADAFDYYFWKHRSKLWWTALQGCQFFGYDWRMPLWDPLLASFWQRIPLEHRFGKRLYVHHIARLEREVGVNQPVRTGTSLYPQRYRFMSIVHAVRLAEPLAKYGVMEHAIKLSGWLRNLSYKKVYDGHRFAWYGIMSREQYGRLHSRRPKNLYAILAAERLGLLSL
jgi:asparagine synthase (glutamine-hydrolysing)